MGAFSLIVVINLLNRVNVSIRKLMNEKMLPTHNKHHGHASHQSVLVTRIPIVISVLLLVCIVYQRYDYQELLAEADYKFYQQEKELAIVRENLFTAKDEIETHKKQIWQEKQTSKSLEAQLEATIKRGSSVTLELESVKRQLTALESKSRNDMHNVSSQLKAAHAKCNSLEKSAKVTLDKCNSNLNIVSANAAKLQSDLQHCVNSYNKISKANPVNNQESANLNLNAAKNPPIEGNVEQAGNQVIQPPVEKQDKELSNQVEARQGVKKELPANEKLIQVRPEDELNEPRPAHPLDNALSKIEEEKQAADGKDAEHIEIVDKVKGFLKQNEVN